MRQESRYIAFEMPQPFRSIPNIMTNEDAWRKATIYSVGDVFDIQYANKARQNAIDKAIKKSNRTDGKGPKHVAHMEYIFTVSMRELIRRYPFMREMLSKYDPDYVAYRNRVDENKRVRDSKKKVGLRFGRS